MNYKLVKNSKVEFGKIIGSNSNVISYSNKKPDLTNYENIPNFVEINKKKFRTGVRWECVEYARRWLIINKGITFDDIDYAVDMYSSVIFRTLDGQIVNHRSVDKQFINNVAMLKTGDLLIYSTDLFPVTGHVAVIVKIDRKNGEIYVAEQNNKKNRWISNDYSFKVSIGDRLEIPGLIGLLSIG